MQRFEPAAPNNIESSPAPQMEAGPLQIPNLEHLFGDRYPNIIVKESNQVPKGQEEVYTIKGFASKMDDSPANFKIGQDFMNWVVENFPQDACLSFDGDKKDPSSYTKFIPLLMERRPDIKLRAYMEWHQFLSRAESWRNCGFDITFYITPALANYEELGSLAMTLNECTEVFVLGGGPTVRNEFAVSPLNVTWRVWHITRPSREDPSVRDPGSLALNDDPRIIHMMEPHV